MYAPLQKKENKSHAVANYVSQKKSDVKQTFGFVDNRPEAVSQRNLQGMANNSPQVKQLMAFQEMGNNRKTREKGNGSSDIATTQAKNNTMKIEQRKMTLHHGPGSALDYMGNTNKTSNVMQRLPWITSDSRRYYRLGASFQQDHILNGTGEECETEATRAAQTNRTKYTIIQADSMNRVDQGTEGADATYDWAMTVNVRCAVGGYDHSRRNYGLLQGFGARNVTIMGYDKTNSRGQSYRLITHITDA